ncbi:hypothetical protein BH09ACT12_BH09ACT12_29240 [soil metagenome]
MPDHDPEVTPEQEARLRRLLAEARHGDPVPVDVAARLGRVLEALATEGPDPDSGHSLVDLAARRRRRVTTLLVAAAAVVVVGVGVGQITRSGQGDAAGSAADSAMVEGAADAPSGADLSMPEDGLKPGDGAGGSPAQQAPGVPFTSSAQDGPAGPRPPVRLTSDAFAKEAVRYRDRRGVESLLGSVIPGEDLSMSETFVCDAADWGEGTLLAALYDGVPTVLAYRPVAGETQAVDLLRCGTGEVLRSTVLPVEH